jgi:integrase
MPTVRVTDSAIRKIISDAASGIRTELTDAATLGLKIRATKDGRAVWSIKLRDITGAQVRVTLGEYPYLGIADARREAAVARHQIRHEGKNPTAEKRAARQKAGTPAEMTLTSLLDEFTRVVKHDSQTWPAYRRLIELVVGPLLDKPASSLTLADLQRGADSYSALGTASRAVAYLRPVLKWGAARDYVDFKTTLISPPRPTIPRERFLNADELRALIIELRGGSNYHEGVWRHAKYPGHRAALMMILYTATRLNEVCGATWAEFDLDPIDGGHPTWTIPPSRIKDTRRAGSKSRTKRPPHVLPLPRQVLAFIIARRPENWRPEDLVFPNEAGGVLDNWDRVTKHLFDVTSTSGWTRHDLRRTAATMMGEMGTLPHVIESVLNHATIHSSLADTYNRSRYLTEVGEALQKWADWIDGLVTVG